MVLLLILIGVYGPRYFMLSQHVDLQQAIQTHADVQSKFSVGIHWGTFELTHEPFLEPQNMLLKLTTELRLEHPFVTMKVGETALIE